jgi:hypothetical protein
MTPATRAKWAAGHVFMLNLRTHQLRHLDAGDQHLRRKENEMRLLKRSSWDDLRAGAPAGRQVIFVYDRACLDFAFWHQAKFQHGLYFISRPKENLSLQRGGEFPWERDDPVNAGVLHDEAVAPLSYSRHLRRITWQNPETGDPWQFLNNEHTLPPGLIVLLYLKRRDIEKVFDETKNKLEERKAWASSTTAKRMQAQFLCLAHNLMVLEEDRLRRAHALTNTAEEKRRAKRLRNAGEIAAKENRALPAGQKALQRITQRSVKFIRWLRTFLWHEAPWERMLAVLRHLYATL